MEFVPFLKRRFSFDSFMRQTTGFAFFGYPIRFKDKFFYKSRDFMSDVFVSNSSKQSSEFVTDNPIIKEF